MFILGSSLYLFSADCFFLFFEGEHHTLLREDIHGADLLSFIFLRHFIERVTFLKPVVS